MTEVQKHGFTFQNWVTGKVFGWDDESEKYTDKWDIPAFGNTRSHLPVSIKVKKYNQALELGDILRQRRINEDFLLIAGFWVQTNSAEKTIKEIGCVEFSAAEWELLWGSLSLEMIQELDQIVKDTSLTYQAARTAAKEWKRQNVPQNCVISVNPKIDSKSQRRVQCSLPFDEFWAKVGRRPVLRDDPDLYGVVFPNPIESAPRVFNKK